MTLKRPRGHPGTLVVLEHSSKILKGNPLGDPHVRKLGVWLPPGYDHGGKRRFPVLYDLAGFVAEVTCSGFMARGGALTGERI